jgi:hypothetical protein
VLGAALAAYPAARAGALTPLAIALAAVAGASLLVTLPGRVSLLVSSLFALATEYVIVEATERADPGSVLVYAPGLVVLCELVFWADELPASGHVEGVPERLLLVAAVAVAAALLALVALAGRTVQLGSAFGAALVGGGAAVCLLAFPLALLRHRRSGA